MLGEPTAAASGTAGKSEGLQGGLQVVGTCSSPGTAAGGIPEQPECRRILSHALGCGYCGGSLSRFSAEGGWCVCCCHTGPPSNCWSCLCCKGPGGFCCRKNPRDGRRGTANRREHVGQCASHDGSLLHRPNDMPLSEQRARCCLPNAVAC